MNIIERLRHRRHASFPNPWIDCSIVEEGHKAEKVQAEPRLESWQENVGSKAETSSEDVACNDVLGGSESKRPRGDDEIPATLGSAYQNLKLISQNGEVGQPSKTYQPHCTSSYNRFK